VKNIGKTQRPVDIGRSALINRKPW